MSSESAHIGYLTMRDGAELAYVAYVPAASHPVPAILTMDAYGISGLSPATAEQAKLSPNRLMEDWLDPQVAHIRQFLDAGYAFIGVNTRGSGASTGEFEWLNPLDGPDGAEVINWIGEQEWCDGNVGMYGASHQAVTLLLVAAERPPNLRAIAPASAFLDTYRDVFCVGGLPNVAFAHKWFNVYQPMLAGLGVEQRVALGDELATRNTPVTPPPIVAQLLEHRDRDSWWEKYSLESQAGSIEIPTLVIHAWQDPAVPASSAVRLFHALRGPKRLVGVNGGHDICVHLFDEILSWFDRWLRPAGDLGSEEASDRRVCVWMEAVPDNDGWVNPAWTIDLDSWPGSAANNYALTPEGGLNPPGEDSSSGVASYLYPIGTQRIGDDAAFAQAPDAAGSLTYRTEALTDELCLLGTPTLTLYVSSQLEDVHLQIGLHDVDPQGLTRFVQQGVHRGSAPTKETSQPGVVEHDYSQRVPLGDGAVHRVELALFPVAHLFRKGHRVELVVMSPSSIPAPEWGFLPLAAAGLHTVHHGPDTPSTLTLPLLTSVPDHPDTEPASATFPSQPARAGVA